MNLIWIKREDSFAQNAAARSAVEAIGRASPAICAAASFIKVRGGYLMVDESCRIVECEPAMCAATNVKGDPRFQCDKAGNQV